MILNFRKNTLTTLAHFLKNWLLNFQHVVVIGKHILNMRYEHNPFQKHKFNKINWALIYFKDEISKLRKC